jgi:hypothetical protein
VGNWERIMMTIHGTSTAIAISACVDIKASKFRVLFPEYNDLSDTELSRRLYSRFGQDTKPEAAPLKRLGIAMSVALGLPLIVLSLGASIMWACAGFSSTRA